MVFSSAFFIYGFMPVFFSLYYLCGDRWKNTIILAASLIFYLIGAGASRRPLRPTFVERAFDFLYDRASADAQAR